MSLHIKAGVTALALILAPLMAEAHHKSGHDNGGGNGRGAQSDHGNGHGNAFGHGRNGGRNDADDRDGAEDEDDEAEGEEEAATGNHPCAPGLASRDTSCVPPGQARRGVTTEDWIGAPTDGYAAGDDISNRDYGVIVNTDQLGLDTDSLEDGQSYALIDDTIVVVDQAGTIVSVVRRAAIPGNSNG